MLMDNSEARSILSLHREGENVDYPRFAEAQRLAAADPALAAWWKEEQEIDRAIAAKLTAVQIPVGLRERLTMHNRPSPIPQRNWRRVALLAAAAVLMLAVFFGSWRGPFQPATSLADYREEMVSFIKLAPSLELETSDLDRITAFLNKSGAPSRFTIPPELRELDPIGCRTLRFRGHNVALVCFKRSDGRLAHLLVTDRNALSELRDAGQPQFSAQGEWMTATWVKGDRAYLLAVQGDEATAKRMTSGV